MMKLNMKGLILSCLLITGFGSAEAMDDDSVRVLFPSEIKSLLGEYPERGSAEEARDFAALLNFQNTRTEEECAMAASEEAATLSSLFAGQNGPLTKKEADVMTVKLLKVYAKIGVNIYLAKNIYKRPRPYDANPDIKPCISLESSYAYPSGHMTMAQVFARVLSRIYPERAQAFMRRAAEVGHHRVLGGVHHPSDIEAGKIFGDAIATELFMSDKTLLAVE